LLRKSCIALGQRAPPASGRSSPWGVCWVLLHSVAIERRLSRVDGLCCFAGGKGNCRRGSWLFRVACGRMLLRLSRLAGERFVTVRDGNRLSLPLKGQDGGTELLRGRRSADRGSSVCRGSASRKGAPRHVVFPRGKHRVRERVSAKQSPSDLETSPESPPWAVMRKKADKFGLFSRGSRLAEEGLRRVTRGAKRWV